MENLSLWLAVAVTWLLIVASYLFPGVFTPLMVFLLLIILVFSIVVSWAISKSTKRSRGRSGKA